MSQGGEILTASLGTNPGTLTADKYAIPLFSDDMRKVRHDPKYFFYKTFCLYAFFVQGR